MTGSLRQRLGNSGTISISVQSAVGTMVVALFTWSLNTIGDHFERTENSITDLTINYQRLSRAIESLPDQRAIENTIEDNAATQQQQQQIQKRVARMIECLRRQRSRDRWHSCEDLGYGRK